MVGSIALPWGGSVFKGGLKSGKAGKGGCAPPRQQAAAVHASQEF